MIVMLRVEKYSKSGLFTCLDKPYYEIEGKTWGNNRAWKHW